MWKYVNMYIYVYVYCLEKYVHMCVKKMYISLVFQRTISEGVKSNGFNTPSQQNQHQQNQKQNNNTQIKATTLLFNKNE